MLFHSVSSSEQIQDEGTYLRNLVYKQSMVF